MFAIVNVLGLDPETFTVAACGRYGYAHRLSNSNINIYYNDAEKDENGEVKRADMGVCIDMSGQGCREYEQLKKDPLALPKLLFSDAVAEGAVTRLDLAYDDFSGKLDLPMMIDKTDRNEIRTKMRQQQEIRGIGEARGLTLYIGSKSSDFRLRIYDKAAEQGVNMRWIRVEAQLRHDISTAFIRACKRKLNITDKEISAEAYQYICDSGAGLILERVAFIEPKDSNKSRCPICAWWTEFFDGAKTVDLLLDEHVPTIESADSWMRKTVAPTLVTLLMLLGPMWLIEILAYGLVAVSNTNSRYNAFEAAYIAAGHTPFCRLHEEDSFFHILSCLCDEIQDFLSANRETAPASEPAKTEMQETNP